MMISDNGISRRNFILGSISISCCWALSRVAWAQADSQALTYHQDSNYYLSQKNDLWKEFLQFNAGAQTCLTSLYGPEAAQGIAKEAERHFRGLIPHFPFAGGAENLNTPFLIQAGWYIAFYKAMQGHGKTALVAGKITYDLVEADWARVPPDEGRRRGALVFSAQELEKLRDYCRRTQQRRYPGDWLAIFIPGDGRTFDFGYDYTECGALKFFRSQRAAAMAPYFCLADFPRSRALGTGLVRTRTLAFGDDRCNFRYRQGRPMKQDWTTEIPKIKIG
jgi:L-2-amino-thiazoline-4-carboxylic acid hydrolase